jgi:hypothetical protein
MAVSPVGLFCLCGYKVSDLLFAPHGMQEVAQNRIGNLWDLGEVVREPAMARRWKRRLLERKGLVTRLVFKTSSRRIKLSVAGSIPALSARNRFSIAGFFEVRTWQAMRPSEVFHA